MIDEGKEPPVERHLTLASNDDEDTAPTPVSGLEFRMPRYIDPVFRGIKRRTFVGCPLRPFWLARRHNSSCQSVVLDGVVIQRYLFRADG